MSGKAAKWLLAPSGVADDTTAVEKVESVDASTMYPPPAPTGDAVKILAEATLTVVLFADASRIDLRTLRREYAVPARLLGIGLPLTIALGALLAAALFGALSVPEALVLAVLLAPTDAALGQAVVTEPRLLRTPLVRGGNRVSLGYAPDDWKTWLEVEKSEASTPER